MRTCAPTGNSPHGAAASGPASGPHSGPHSGPEAGFTLIEMLVAMVLLSLVGMTLARFQTFQLAGAANLATAAAARLEADNLAVEVLAAPAAPAAPIDSVSANAGREWHSRITPGPSPGPATMPDLVTVDIAVALVPGGPAVAQRTVVRGRGNPGAQP